jgi:hypothetical protein
MQASIHDNNGLELSATVTLEPADDACSITFESRGPARNTDYGPGFRVAIGRLVAAGAALLDAEVFSREIQHLPIEARRLAPEGFGFPIQCSGRVDAGGLASSLERASAAVARRPGAKGGGNRTRRLRLTVRLPLAGVTTVDRVLDVVIAPASADRISGEQVERRRFAQSAGQGFGLPSEAKRAVELRAMLVAREHLLLTWKIVDDVSGTESFDLFCSSDGQQLFVEVKGTTSLGGSVMLTANEVELARHRAPATALVVVDSIEIMRENGDWTASGGRLRMVSPWNPDSHLLIPQSFRCVLSPTVSE